MNPQSFVESPEIARIFDKPGTDWSFTERFSIKLELLNPGPYAQLLLIARRRLPTEQEAEDALQEYWVTRLDKHIDTYDPDKGLRFWSFVQCWFRWFCRERSKQKPGHQAIPLPKQIVAPFRQGNVADFEWHNALEW